MRCGARKALVGFQHAPNQNGPHTQQRTGSKATVARPKAGEDTLFAAPLRMKVVDIVKVGTTAGKTRVHVTGKWQGSRMQDCDRQVTQVTNPPHKKYSLDS